MLVLELSQWGCKLGTKTVSMGGNLNQLDLVDAANKHAFKSEGVQLSLFG